MGASCGIGGWGEAIGGLVFGKQIMAQRCHIVVKSAFILTVLIGSGSVATASNARSTHEIQNIRLAIQRIIKEVQLSHQLTISCEGLQPELYSKTDLIFQEAEPKDFRRVYSFLSLLKEELNKYPPGFLKQQQVQKIYLVKGLFNEDKNAQGIYDYRRKLILFDFARQFGGGLAQRHNIHHEIFHVIDTNSFFWQGKEDWEDLNSPDFRYVKKGKVIMDPERNEANYFAPTRKGFVTYYSMMSPFEDKAEVFACLFVPSQNRLIHRWAEKDKILRKKIEYIKDFLRAYSDGVVDEDYLSDMLNKNASR